MQEPRRARAAADLVEPTQRIVAQAGARTAAAADQAVLDIVDVAVGAIRGQIAVGVVAEPGAGDRAVLIEAVGGVAAIGIDREIRVMIGCRTG